MSVRSDYEAGTDSELEWLRLQVRALADLYHKHFSQNQLDLGGDPAEHGPVLMDDSVAKEVWKFEAKHAARVPRRRRSTNASSRRAKSERQIPRRRTSSSRRTGVRAGDELSWTASRPSPARW